MTPISQQVRIVAVEHRITPEKWSVVVEFAADQRVAKPQQTSILPAPHQT